MINYAQIASDAAVPETTVKAHFQYFRTPFSDHTGTVFRDKKRKPSRQLNSIYLTMVRHSLMRLQNRTQYEPMERI